MEELITQKIWVQFLKEIPIDTLKKGDYISPETLERVVDRPRNNTEYRLCLLGLRIPIKKHFEDKNQVVTITLEGDGMRVLTDNEAAVYNANQFRAKVSGAYKMHKQLCGVDVSQLSREKLEFHDKNIIYQGRILQNISAAQVSLKPTIFQGNKEISRINKELLES